MTIAALAQDGSTYTIDSSVAKVYLRKNTTNSSTPISFDQMDNNFELLRLKANECVSQINTNTTAISANTTQINTNTTAISANTTQINTNTTAISANTTHRTTTTGNPHGVTASDVGLSDVDNTSDSDKPVSTAQQTALDLKADLADPTFTGTVSGITASMVGLGSASNHASIPASDLDTTAALGTSDTKVPSQNAVKSYVDSSVSVESYDSGWVASGGPLSTTVAQATNMTVTHNFGRDDYIVQLLAADSSSGGNNVRIDYNDHGNARRGANIYDIANNTLKIRFWNKYRQWSGGGEGTYVDWTGKYIRIILIAA